MPVTVSINAGSPNRRVMWQGIGHGAAIYSPCALPPVISYLESGQLPPTDAFWSLTMGDGQNRYLRNPINRYHAGDRSGLVPNADVCASAGRRISVSGCANIADVVAPYVPPPAYYAPMPYDPPPPPNVTGCVSYNGRWVNAGGCN